MNTTVDFNKVTELMVRILLLPLTVVLGYLNLKVAPTQLNIVGFAAGNREPNEFAQMLNYGLVIVCIFFFLWVLIHNKPRYQLPTFGAITVFSLIVYFMIW